MIIFRLENEEEEEEEEDDMSPEYSRRKVLVNNSGIPEMDSEGELIDQDYCAKMYLKVGKKYFRSLKKEHYQKKHYNFKILFMKDYLEPWDEF